MNDEMTSDCVLDNAAAPALAAEELSEWATLLRCELSLNGIPDHQVRQEIALTLMDVNDRLRGVRERLHGMTAGMLTPAPALGRLEAQLEQVRLLEQVNGKLDRLLAAKDEPTRQQRDLAGRQLQVAEQVLGQRTPGGER